MGERRATLAERRLAAGYRRRDDPVHGIADPKAPLSDGAAIAIVASGGACALASPFALAFFMHLCGDAQLLLLRMFSPWPPLIRELEGQGHGVNARLPMEGHQVTLRATRRSAQSLFNAELVTEARTPAKGPPLTIHPLRLGKLRRKGTPLRTGDDAFDAAYTVWGPQKATALFTEEVRAVMLAYGGRVRLADGALRLTIRGFEEDLDKVRQLLSDTAMLATALAAPRESLPVLLQAGTRDPLPRVRERSLRTLIDDFPTHADDAARALLDDPDADVRILAAAQLDRLDLLIGTVLDPDGPAERQDRALEALAHAATRGEPLPAQQVEGLVRLATSAHRDGHPVALRCLRRRGGVDALAPLRALAADAGFLSGRRRMANTAIAAILERADEQRGSVALAEAAGDLSLTDGPSRQRPPPHADKQTS